MRNKRRCGKTTAAVFIFAAAMICLCFVPLKVFLVVIALALIALGIWLLKHC